MYKINFFYKYPGIIYSNLEDFVYAEGWPGFVDPSTIIETSNEAEDFADFYGDYGPPIKITAGNYDTTKVRLTVQWNSPSGVPPLLPPLFNFNPGDYSYMYKHCLLSAFLEIVDFAYEPDDLPFLSMTTVKRDDDSAEGARIITGEFTVVPRIKLKPPPPAP